MTSLKSITLLALVVLTLTANAVVVQAKPPSSSHKLPIFFFHGSFLNATAAANYAANLTAEGRVFNALSFCQDACTIEGLDTQVSLAIAQIRSIIVESPKTYANGYVFIGHSQGGTIARAVIEEMDDHKVITFISLAGAQNGNFFGPQVADTVPLYIFQASASAMIPTSVFNFSAYAISDYRGKAQYDFDQALANKPSAGQLYSAVNLYRSPLRTPWLSWNPFLPVYNNINKCKCHTTCSSEQARRKNNFLRLKNAHFFASPRDGVISPYQSSLFGQYSDVTNASQIQTSFESLEIVPMTSTIEYTTDSYGLKTLDTTDRLHLHEIAAVAHMCWIQDTAFYDNTSEFCSFQTNYDKHVYPLLQ